MSRFFSIFVTEKPENRDVTLFGSIQNAKIPAPTPSLSLMSGFFSIFVTEKYENRDVTLFGSSQNAKIPAPTPLIPDVTLLFLRMCEICVGSIIRRALAAASERPATRPSA